MSANERRILRVTEQVASVAEVVYDVSMPAGADDDAVEDYIDRLRDKVGGRTIRQNSEILRVERVDFDAGRDELGRVLDEFEASDWKREFDETPLDQGVPTEFFYPALRFTYVLKRHMDDPRARDAIEWTKANRLPW